MDYSLLVFGEDWGAHPSSTQYLVARLAQRHSTLWVNSIGMRRPRLNGRDLRRAVQKCAALLRSRQQNTSDPFPVLAPLALPLPGSNIATRINRGLLGAQLRKALRDAGIERPVLWTSLPTAVDLVGCLDECAVVYYCGDDFGALEGVDHEPILAMEQRLVARADLVLSSHSALMARFPTQKSYLVPHGVDTASFASDSDRPVASQRIAGFCGCIDSRLHQEALIQAARTLTAWQFELVGPLRCDVSMLAALPNVRVLPAVPAKEVPAVLHRWSVALLPYRDNAMVRACNPLKLREYLASGTAIAAIDMAAITPYRELVCSGAPEQLPASILDAAAHNDRCSRQARQRAVAEEDWQQRADQVDELIQTVLARRSLPAAA